MVVTVLKAPASHSDSNNPAPHAQVRSVEQCLVWNAGAGVGRNRTLHSRPNLQSIDFPKYVRMDTCLLCGNAIPQLLPATLLLVRGLT